MFCAQCGQWLADGEAACPRCGAPAHGTAVGPLPAAGPAASAPPPPLRYGGFWRRLGTFVVDSLVMFFPAAIVRVLFGEDAWGMEPVRDFGNAARAVLVNAGLWWLYCALLESSPARGTLGQQLMNLRVCDDRLRRVSFGRATARHFAQYLSAATLGIGYLVNLWTKKRQTLHDLAAGCVLARAESLPGPAPGTGDHP